MGAGQAKLLAAPPQEETWPTFAGDPSRNRVLPAAANDPERLSRLWVEEPWRFSLEERERALLAATNELERKSRELEVLAFRDGLTGLYNHRSFHERLREETARARRYGKPLSLISMA